MVNSQSVSEVCLCIKGTMGVLVRQEREGCGRVVAWRGKAVCKEMVVSPCLRYVLGVRVL